MINTITGKGLLFFLLLLAFFQLNAQSDSLYLSPSFYYTHGIYSDKTNSDAYSFFNTIEPVRKLYLINHFEKLFINNSAWDYDQSAILAGGIVDQFPYYIKFNFAHYAGKYAEKLTDYSYKDYTNLYNLDAFYYIDSWYIGPAFVHLNRIGFANQQTNQFTLRIEKILSFYTYLSLKPTYIKINSGQELFSIYAKMHYQAYDNLLLKAGGFIGKRINYFDTDLLTIFNQDYIQKHQVFVQAEFDPLKWLRLIFSYQNTGFEDFSINYIVLGLKSNLYL